MTETLPWWWGREGEERTKPLPWRQRGGGGGEMNKGKSRYLDDGEGKVKKGRRRYLDNGEKKVKKGQRRYTDDDDGKVKTEMSPWRWGGQDEGRHSRFLDNEGEVAERTEPFPWRWWGESEGKTVPLPSRWGGKDEGRQSRYHDDEELKVKRRQDRDINMTMRKGTWSEDRDVTLTMRSPVVSMSIFRSGSTLPILRYLWEIWQPTRRKCTNIREQYSWESANTRTHSQQDVYSVQSAGSVRISQHTVHRKCTNITKYSPQEVYKYSNIQSAGNVQISQHTVRRKCTSIREQIWGRANTVTHSPQEVYKYHSIQLIGSVKIKKKKKKKPTNIRTHNQHGYHTPGNVHISQHTAHRKNQMSQHMYSSQEVYKCHNRKLIGSVQNITKLSWQEMSKHHNTQLTESVKYRNTRTAHKKCTIITTDSS